MKTQDYLTALAQSYKLGTFKVTNNITKRGALNEMVSQIKEINIGRNVIGLRFYNGKLWVVDPVQNIVNKTNTIFYDAPLKGDARLNNGRPTFNIENGLGSQNGIAVSKLIAIINDLVLNNFNTKEDYEVLDGAHMDGSGSSRYGLKVNNLITNIELTNSKANKEHNIVFTENMDKHGIWIKSCATDPYISWFRNKGVINTHIIDELTVSQCHLSWQDNGRYILKRQDKNSPYIPVDYLTKEQYKEQYVK